MTRWFANPPKAHERTIFISRKVSGTQGGTNLNPVYLLEKAKALHQSGNFAKAVEGYKNVFAQNPANAVANHGMGQILFAQSKIPEAIEYFQAAVQYDEKQASFYLDLASALQAAGQFSDAAACYQKALAIQPDSAEAYTRLADLFRRMGNIDSAQRSLRMALRHEPKNHPTRLSACAEQHGIVPGRAGKHGTGGICTQTGSGFRYDTPEDPFQLFVYLTV